jgi:hypothetical protein
MKNKNNYSLFSWCPPLATSPPLARSRLAADRLSAEPRPWAGLCVVVVNLLSVMGLWKACTASVPDFTVHLYRKVPQSTAKRVKKFGPKSVADYRKVMATMMIRKLDEVAKKRFARKCTAKSGIQKSALRYGST